MKLLLTVLFSATLIFGFAGQADADVWVNGYTRSNGTYVQGHYRSSPDSSPYNNYSYPGNTNPYTGATATGNPSTYLKNYSSTSLTPTYTTPKITVPTYTAPSYTFPTYTSAAVGLSSGISVPTRSGSVVYEEYSCDYFIVESNLGTYSLLEWYGGRIPSTGDRVYGPITGFGFKDIYTSASQSKTRVWIEDYWLSESSVVEKYVDKCD